MKLKSTGLKFKNLGNPPTTIQTPDNHISLPTQVLAVGSVGRGKTFWITNLLRQLKESKCMDRIFFISSTVSSNLKLLQDLDIKEHDIYDPEDPDCIANVY
jgi:DNA helicase HerA-like ATPase